MKTVASKSRNKHQKRTARIRKPTGLQPSEIPAGIVQVVVATGAGLSKMGYP